MPHLRLEQVGALLVIDTETTGGTVGFGYESDDEFEVGDDPFVETEGDDEEGDA